MLGASPLDGVGGYFPAAVADALFLSFFLLSKLE